jgi:hypothetical protein
LPLMADMLSRLDERRTGGCHASAGEGGVRREHVDDHSNELQK